MDSPDCSPNDQPTLESVPNKAGASLEEGILTGGPPNVNKIGGKAPSWVTTAPILPPRLDRLLLSMYVPSQEMIHPPTSMATLDLEGALEIIHL